MASQHVDVEVPEELLKEIDAAVGPENRKAFLIATAQTELRKRRLLAFLQSDAGWKEEDHPEWINGSAAWVDSLRRESDARIAQPEGWETAAD